MCKVWYRWNVIKWATCHSCGSGEVEVLSRSHWHPAGKSDLFSALFPTLKPCPCRPTEQMWMNRLWWLVFSLLQYLSLEPDGLYLPGRRVVTQETIGSTEPERGCMGAGLRLPHQHGHCTAGAAGPQQSSAAACVPHPYTYVYGM